MVITPNPRTRLWPAPAAPRRRACAPDSTAQSIAGSRVQQLCHKAGPAGLVRCAKAAPRLTVEVLMEEDVVAELRIPPRTLTVAVQRPVAVLVAQEQPR